MKKRLLVVFALIPLVTIIPSSYAQTPVPSDEPQEFPITADEHLVWSEADSGTATFPAGQVIAVGAERDVFELTGAYTSELQMDSIEVSISRDTEVTSLSGCFVVEVPSTAENDFRVNFNDGLNSLVVRVPEFDVTSMGFCVQDEQTVVCLVDGAAGISVYRQDEMFISSVEECVTINREGKMVIKPSSIGDTYLP